MLGRWGLVLPWPTAGDGNAQPIVEVVRVAHGAEQAGCTSLWVDDTPGLAADRADAYSILGILAASTTVAHLGTLPARGSPRYPGIVAKIVSTVDVLSSGRAVACLPVHPGPDGSSPTDLEDSLRICRAVLDDEAPTVRGSVFSVDGAVNRPAPVAPAGVPLAVGVPTFPDDGGIEDVDDSVLGLIGSYADIALVVGNGTTGDGSPEERGSGRERRIVATAARIRAAADRADRPAGTLRVFGVVDVGHGRGGAGTPVMKEEVDRACSVARSLTGTTPGGGLDGVVLDLSAMTAPTADLLEAIAELGAGLAS